MGDELVILAHHYQRPEVVRFADHIGDSFVLSKEAAASRAQRIVFCGVHFMAEAAAILARPGQQVFMPDPKAGCPMADMADIDDVEFAIERIKAAAGGRSIVPVTYINSNSDVKALVGRLGGTICTSSNASQALKWAAAQGDLVLFLPDEYLGTNTAFDLGYERIAVWNPHVPDGGVDPELLSTAQVVVWKGYCHVHTYFTPQQVEAARSIHSGCSVVVHPECRPEVVRRADGSGSTAYIVRWVESAPAGSTVVVGTEMNLVQRLAAEYAEKKVVPLVHSLCPNMYRTTVAKLARLLETFEKHHEVTVEPETARWARKALDQMLALPQA